MKIICVILLLLIFLGCKKNLIEKEMNSMNEMNFVPNKSMKIKNLSLFKIHDVCVGSYVLKNDALISQYEIESKYSLMVIKLKNISQNFTFNDHKTTNYATPGYFSTINEGLFEVNLSPELFKDIGIVKEVVDEILKKLDQFEKQKGYLTSIMTIQILSSTFETNSKYVLKIVNIYKKNVYPIFK